MKNIALTFDDGPNLITTPGVLDLLEENEIVASFFLIGENIRPETESVAKRAFKIGCELNNHSMTHGYMDQMDPAKILEEINECSRRIAGITGSEPKFFRPPYVAVNQQLFETVDLTFICGVGCRDWEPEVTAEQRIGMLRQRVQEGDIVLLHDMRGNINTVEALRVMIPEWKAQGYHFVTCGQLFDQAAVIPERKRLYTNVWQTMERVER